MNRRRLVEFAFLLPWVGVFLLTPPVMIMLQTWTKAAGFPLFTIYMFVVWLALIVAGGVVATRLSWTQEARPRGEGPHAPDVTDG